MARTSKFKGLEIELASSILYYDKEESLRFFDIYDAISAESHISIDGIFDLFVSYMKKFKGFEIENPTERRQKLIDEINLRNNQNSNKTIRENFDLWFSQVLETEIPFELADDILNRLIWEEYKKAIDSIDKSNIPFKDKLAVRPKIPKALNQDDVVNLNEITHSKKSLAEYTTGLEELDKLVKLKRGNFVVIAARPGVGKSLLMLAMAIANSRQGVKSLFVSLEMTKEQLDIRIVNHYVGENLQSQYEDENGVLNFESWEEAHSNAKKTKGYRPINENLKIYPSKTKSADSILNKIENMIKEEGYDVIFLDYLQLLRYNSLNEWESLRQLTTDLKSLAFRTNTLMVTGCQVSRSSTEKGLYLTDLFGSSTIEADTDIVIGLENTKERRQGEKAVLNVKSMKNREGDLGELHHTVDYSTGRLTYDD